MYRQKSSVYRQKALNSVQRAVYSVKRAKSCIFRKKSKYTRVLASVDSPPCWIQIKKTIFPSKELYVPSKEPYIVYFKSPMYVCTCFIPNTSVNLLYRFCRRPICLHIYVHTCIHLYIIVVRIHLYIDLRVALIYIYMYTCINIYM